jgi:hypothetical protein
MFNNIKIFVGDAGLRKTLLWKRLKNMYCDYLTNKKLNSISHEIIGNPDGLRILVINHFFDGEIESLTKVLSQINDTSILPITPEPYFSKGITLFSEDIQCARIAYDDPSLMSVRDEYRKHCKKLYKKIYENYPFDCLVTPSDCFFWLREFVEVCKQNGILTVVADKEGTITPQSFETEPKRMRKFFPPISDYYFVWNERQMLFWEKAGASKDLIKLIGSARSDLFINIRKNESKKDILFFDFDIDAYINNIEIGKEEEEKDWSLFRKSIYQVLIEIAREYQEVTIIVKCHPQQVVNEVMGINISDYKNIKIVKGAPRGIPDMISNARAVIGFQTTALLEASLTKAPVLYVAWGDLYDKVKDKILPWNTDGYGILWCKSPAEFKKEIVELIAGGEDKYRILDRSKIEEYFYNADGQVGMRLINNIKKLKK